MPRYHIFLGHRQVGGGSHIGELDALLTLWLGLRCWRDTSQTIQDVNAMIRGVAESSVYLLYLTSDALSCYVTIEARAAMALKKPCLILMENNKEKPAYAGGSIDAATAGWPADLQEYFSTGRYVSWGGEPFEWSDAGQNAKLRTIFERCAEVGPPVPWWDVRRRGLERLKNSMHDNDCHGTNCRIRDAGTPSAWSKDLVLQ